MQPIISAHIALLMSMMLMFNFSFATKPATVSQSEECSRSSSSKDTCSSTSPIHYMSNLTIGILGTGRLGAHVAATWAAAGHRVLLGSRNPSKAREIVEAIRSLAGYRGKGGEQTKALPDGHRIELEGTDMAGGRFDFSTTRPSRFYSQAPRLHQSFSLPPRSLLLKVRDFYFALDTTALGGHNSLHL